MELDIISTKDTLLHLEFYFWTMVKGVNMTDNQRHSARLCFHEVMTNALKHGNNFDGSKHILVQREVIDSKLIFKIKDEGHGFDYNQSKDPLLRENMNVPSGRGLFLIKELACLSEYCMESKTMKFVFNLSA